MVRWLPACDQNPASVGRLDSQTKPFDRTTPGQGASSASARRPGWKGRRARNTKLDTPYSSVSGAASAWASSQPGSSAEASGS